MTDDLDRALREQAQSFTRPTPAIGDLEGVEQRHRARARTRRGAIGCIAVVVLVALAVVVRPTGDSEATRVATMPDGPGTSAPGTHATTTAPTTAPTPTSTPPDIETTVPDPTATDGAPAPTAPPSTVTTPEATSPDPADPTLRTCTAAGLTVTYPVWLTTPDEPGWFCAAFSAEPIADLSPGGPRPGVVSVRAQTGTLADFRDQLAEASSSAGVVHEWAIGGRDGFCYQLESTGQGMLEAGSQITGCLVQLPSTLVQIEVFDPPGTVLNRIGLVLPMAERVVEAA